MYKTKKNTLLLILGFLILILSSCAAAPPSAPRGSGGEGILKHTVMSPFNDELDSQEATYFAGISSSPVFTTIKSRYADFALNYDSSSLGFNSEPFCRIGGSYKINIANINPTAADLNTTVELYYCQTTNDLIDQVTIPSTWEDDNLVFYCNDGNTINFADVNFEFLTTQVNTYKSCVLKNLDLEEKNTVLYGFEVGNKIVDDDPSFLFDPQTFTSQVTKDLTLDTVQESVPKFGDLPREVWVDFIETCSFQEVQQNNNGENGGSNNVCKDFTQTCALSPPPGPGQSSCGQELVNTQIEIPDSEGGQPQTVTCQVPQTKRCDVVTPAVQAELSEFQNIRRVRDDALILQSLFEVDEIVGYNFTEYVFTDSNDENFFFEYDSHKTFYSMKDVQEELTVPLSNVFLVPNDFELSRVALFRSFSDGRKAYGFETPARFKVQSSSTKPIYKIQIESTNGASSSETFSQNDCFTTLASYDAVKKDSISVADTITCTSTNNILLNTITLDQNFDKQTAFNLFKNIILDLE